MCENWRNETMTEKEQRIQEYYDALHAMPEVGFEEFRTSAWLADKIKAAGFSVQTGVGGTGVVATLKGKEAGPVVALRADMDALQHTVGGEEVRVHSCGHDSHCTMVLTAAEELSKAGIARGTLKILFQPAEEKLFGATRMIEAGAIDDVDIVLGIHLRPIQEAKTGQATPALYHGSSYIMEATITGQTAHGARPHLGVNAIDAAAAAVNAVNAIHINPVIPCSCKVTKLTAGGATLNQIPDKAVMALDCRAQQNEAMQTLLSKAEAAIKAGAATVGATAVTEVKGGVPGAEYNPEIIELAREAIREVLGEEGLLEPIVTPGGEDFHNFVQAKPSIKAGYIGLGCNLTPGLHDPSMKFDRSALIYGSDILAVMVRKLLK
jgi:amidohydrolase